MNKSEDYNKFKKLCEDHGYELLNESKDDNDKFYVVSKEKDIWEGVEYVRLLSEVGTIIIKKINPEIMKAIKSFAPNGNEFFQPSTEKEYVYQLITTAKELFGDIKISDKFIEPNGNIDYWDGSNSVIEFDYIKYEDKLFFRNVIIFHKGEWAKKLTKRIKVKFEGGRFLEQSFYFLYENGGIQKLQLIGYASAGEFLAKQLEKYLNGEIE